MFVYYDYVTSRFPTAHPLSPADMVVGTVVTVLVLEATRRTLGAALSVLSILFIVYGVAGPWLPGVLRHKGLSWEILIDQTFFTSEGIFGIPLGVAGSYVVLFIVFGAFLEKSGAGQFFMNFANAIAGGSRGGPGKVAVVSSSLFGTISGSAVANVMVDGWLTIPMMKRTGFKPEAAAAIEAVASTGGQIMPPVMGAASFVMAEFLGVPYSHIMLAAAIPAIFYYGALFAAIHFNAARTGLQGIPRHELPDLRAILWRQGHLLVPVVVIFALLLQGFTATYAAIISTVSVLVVSWLRAETRITLPKAIEALRDGAYQTVPVAMATAAAGIMIGIILQTGLAIRFTSFLVDMAGGALIVALLITMVAAVILGTALPTTPAYIMLAALLIPALIKLGVPPAGRPHVRLLLRLPLVGHAAGVPGGVRGGLDQPVQRVGRRLAGDEVRLGRLHRALLLRILAGAALRRPLGRDRARPDHRDDRGGRAGGRARGLLLAAGELGRAGPLPGGRLPADRPRPLHRPGRARGAGDRAGQPEAPPSRLRDGPLVSRLAQTALTVIAVVLLAGVILYGVFRIYG